MVRKYVRGGEDIFRKSKIFSAPPSSAPKFLVAPSFWGIFYSHPQFFSECPHPGARKFSECSHLRADFMLKFKYLCINFYHFC